MNRWAVAYFEKKGGHWTHLGTLNYMSFKSSSERADALELLAELDEEGPAREYRVAYIDPDHGDYGRVRCLYNTGKARHPDLDSAVEQYRSDQQERAEEARYEARRA